MRVSELIELLKDFESTQQEVLIADNERGPRMIKGIMAKSSVVEGIPFLELY